MKGGEVKEKDKDRISKPPPLHIYDGFVKLGSVEGQQYYPPDGYLRGDHGSVC